MISNKNFPIGTKLRLISSASGIPKTWWGKEVVTVSVPYITTQYTYVTVSKTDKPAGARYTLYLERNDGGVVDQWSFPSRDDQIKVQKENIVRLQKELNEAQKDLDYLVKYDSEEEFVAAKLDELMSAHATAKSTTTRVKLMAEILGELKSSNLL